MRDDLQRVGKIIRITLGGIPLDLVPVRSEAGDLHTRIEAAIARHLPPDDDEPMLEALGDPSPPAASDANAAAANAAAGNTDAEQLEPIIAFRPNER
jgi:hypothetical protein